MARYSFAARARSPAARISRSIRRRLTRVPAARRARWIHALRHACGAELLRRTKNLRVVQEQLRHVDVQTTTGYTRLTQQDVRQALETLDDEGE